MDVQSVFGFIYADADERTAPDEKEDAVSNYAEQPGENRDGRVVDAPFDYTVIFVVEAPNKDLTNANAKISDFNNRIRGRIDDTDIKRKKEITFYNYLNRVKIVGYPDVIAKPTKVWHSDVYGELDYAKIELKIRVTDPSKCDFNLSTDNL
ncbi:MAG: hypothetical protein NC311_09655 [Muribaculaceae bacterium]|nr:hypothetical protein [Muribaculaceae bacterium]